MPYVEPVGNNDRCGRCGTRHGGNNHYCPVHGSVSEGCCVGPCDKANYVLIGQVNERYPNLAPRFKLKLRTEVNLDSMMLDPPYKFQDDGSGNYKANHIERFIEPTVPSPIEVAPCQS